MEKKEKEKVRKSLVLDKAVYDAVSESANQDTRSINAQIQVLIMEALEHRKKQLKK